MNPCAILELYRYHSGIAQQSENSHFAQDNSRIVPIPTLRRTYINIPSQYDIVSMAERFHIGFYAKCKNKCDEMYMCCICRLEEEAF